ncbi:MAG: histidinol-phosphate transaminase [Archaeoglobales archaeon]|nr:histidinol-phosphate transaminase [Archaeoglobales archaeon]
MRSVLNIINPYDPGIFPEDVGEAIQLASNENPYEPSENVKKAYLEALKKINRYPSAHYRKLKEYIADYIGCDISNISVGCGAGELIGRICDCIADELDKVVIPVPSFTLYAIYAMLRNTSIQNPYFPNYEVEADVIAEMRPKLVFLCSPNNPTGNTLNRKTVERIAEFSEYVVLDEAYVEYADESLVDLAMEYENLIVLRSFSKFFGLAGLRIGYCISSPRIAEAIEKVRLPFAISQPAIHCAIAALSDLEYYKKLRDITIQERERLYKELKSFKWLKVFPSKANFIFAKTSIDGLAEMLLERGIIVRSIRSLIGLEGSHVRITVGRREENDILLNALRSIDESIGGKTSTK